MAHEISREVRLNLLRGFDLHIDHRPVEVIWSVKRLLAFLALTDRPLSRAYVAGTLWSDSLSDRANANLRSSLWRTQRACRLLIVATSQNIALGPHVRVDVRTAIGRAHHLLEATAPVHEADLSTHTRLDLAADLLPDWYDDWVTVERERFRQLRLHALEAMCERLTAIGRYGQAVDAGLAAVRAEPLRESAHRTLIRAHLAEGNLSEAVRQYEHCRRLWREELGLEPSRSLSVLLPASSRPWAAAMTT
jgi:DNA-binding SARP family transcriptional activator